MICLFPAFPFSLFHFSLFTFGDGALSSQEVNRLECRNRRRSPLYNSPTQQTPKQLVAAQYQELQLNFPWENGWSMCSVRLARAQNKNKIIRHQPNHHNHHRSAVTHRRTFLLQTKKRARRLLTLTRRSHQKLPHRKIELKKHHHLHPSSLACHRR